MTTEIDELATYLGDYATAQELADWAARTARVLRIPARPWTGRGYTGARLAQVIVLDPLRPPQLVVVKVLPSGQDVEAAAHRRAVREAPEPFRRHFVEQIFDSVSMRDGRMLTFQAPAGRRPVWRPLSQLPSSAFPDACQTVTDALIRGWNPDYTVETVDVAQALRTETADAVAALPAGFAAAAEPWFRTTADAPLPCPLHAVSSNSIFGGELADRAVGRVHGDLHTLNVLVRHWSDVTEYDSFVFVDLMTYRHPGQLAHDPVCLLLSAAAGLLPDVSEPAAQRLLQILVRPDRGRLGTAGLIGEVLHAVYDTAADLLSTSGVWHTQYLMTLVTNGVSMASYATLPGPIRWWFFRLAAYAARDLLMEFGRSAEIPADAPLVANPFEVVVVC